MVYDAEFSDGISVVTVFYTKDGFDVQGPSHPKVVIDIAYSDGKEVVREVSEVDGTNKDAYIWN